MKNCWCWTSSPLRLVVIACVLCRCCLAQESESEFEKTQAALLTGEQQAMNLLVEVVDVDGKPIEGARVIPWALRFEGGHGIWQEDDKRSGISPQTVVTDEFGRATVIYPYFRDIYKKMYTLEVSLRVDHPDFAVRGREFVDVPQSSSPVTIVLERGYRLEVCPLLNGVPTDRQNVYAIWSDQRSWDPEVKVEKLPGGVLRLPALGEGRNLVLLVRLEGDTATHFSKWVEFEIGPGRSNRIDVPLFPSVRVEGQLSANVPRPVRSGRINIRSLHSEQDVVESLPWMTWVPVRPDGTFTVNGWPASQPMQVTAICDGYIAESGIPPGVVRNPASALVAKYHRPQAFDPEPGRLLKIAMTPLVPFKVMAVDAEFQPIIGLQLVSWPNVGWWNGGSQIYCEPLVRGERLVRDRDFWRALDQIYPQPFSATTDHLGQAVLQLPQGREGLAVTSEIFEHPGGHVYVESAFGELNSHTLVLQPKWTEELRAWDRLATSVLNCSTAEGRRILALPAIQSTQSSFIAKLETARASATPELQAEIFSTIANAFASSGAEAESTKWQQKANEAR